MKIVMMFIILKLYHMILIYAGKVRRPFRKEACFLSSGWPKLWPLVQPQIIFSSFFLLVRKILKILPPNGKQN